jgi:hypothetical protein
MIQWVADPSATPNADDVVDALATADRCGYTGRALHVAHAPRHRDRRILLDHTNAENRPIVDAIPSAVASAAAPAAAAAAAAPADNAAFPLHLLVNGRDRLV